MEGYEAFPSLELDRPAAHILRLTLRAPGRLNAVSGSMHRELAALWPAIGEDGETRAVLVRGADGAFSAGGDLDLVLEIAHDPATRLRVFQEARDLVYNLVDCPKPVVSAMTGPAVGAGLAVGLLADISLATPATSRKASPPSARSARRSSPRGLRRTRPSVAAARARARRGPWP